jgi:hypothetical protein
VALVDDGGMALADGDVALVDDGGMALADGDVPLVDHGGVALADGDVALADRGVALAVDGDWVDDDDAADGASALDLANAAGPLLAAGHAAGTSAALAGTRDEMGEHGDDGDDEGAAPGADGERNAGRKPDPGQEPDAG